ncbi:ABC transporter substrate-binding protein [Saccharothrix sp. NPDC042600]|uniref:ABC transporter substrate-binding protein n=1 Tax=Saccharothrix TaxID=2071 RepID=UPI0033E85A71|nr:ABC transporter substrate-binding protein [Saccharothrix mutabilis subsp. capreolus]
MPEQRDSAVTLTHRAIRLRESDPDEARALLGRALALDAGYEPAWRWLADLVTDVGERKFCLDRAYDLKADPDTQRARAALKRVASRAPDEVADLVEPPRPDPVRARPRRSSRTGRWIGVGAAALVLLAAVGTWSLSHGSEGTPVHVALVTGMTGDGAVLSTHMEQSLRMHLDGVNAAGGVAGHPVVLRVYDDADQPAKAKAVAEEIVRDDEVLFVVGHRTSDAALAALPVYKEAGIPAITPTAGSSRITDESEWYFRSMFGSRTQNDFLAVYTSRVLGAKSAAVAFDDDEFGRATRDGFGAVFGGFGAVAAEVPIAADDPDRAVAALAGGDPTMPIVLATGERQGVRMIQRLRAAGVTAPIVGTATVGTRAAHDALVAAEREQGKPGLFTSGLHLATPMAADALSGPALAWAQEYEQRYGERPLWPAATARQALNVGLHAAATGGLKYDEPHRADDRRLLRDALAALKDKKNSFHALLGPLYFTANGSAQMPVHFQTSDGTRLMSAPVQLGLYEPPSEAALRDGLAKGTVIGVGDRYLSRRQVVSTGINLNEIRDLDTRDGTYYVDFFLWLKYTGDHGAADVHFVNAVNPDLRPGTPLRDITEDGRTYRLYRVAGRFKAGFDFRSFPFDRQHLEVRLQNRTQPADQVLYVTDKEILNQTPDHYLRSGTDAESGINRVPNWQAVAARFFQLTVGSSDALGDSKVVGAATGIYYSQYAVEVEIARDVGPFLVKNLLPLALLIAVTYLSLFFKATDGAAPVSMGITAILSAAVLLNNVTSQLPSVSYTVALEWGYYAFILLAAMCVLNAMLRKRLINQGQPQAEHTLAIAARIGYPTFIVAVVAAYAAAFV